MSEIRWDPSTGNHVIIAPQRGNRPHRFHKLNPGDSHPPCPFCPGEEQLTPSESLVLPHPTAIDRWQVRVVPNKFPVLEGEAFSPLTTHGSFRLMEGAGFHEVVIESPRHDLHLHQFSHEELELVLAAWQKRYIALSCQPSIRYVQIFKNHGAGAGASQDHPHSQILALPLIPPKLGDELQRARRFYIREKECFYCQTLSQYGIGERMVAENRHFIACSPFVPRLPYEIWLLPKEHNHDFGLMTPDQRKDLTALLQEVLTRYYGALGDPPFNLMIHSAPQGKKWENSYHWHMEILPLRGKIGGLEWSTGIFVNSISPEEGARILREFNPNSK